MAADPSEAVEVASAESVVADVSAPDSTDTPPVVSRKVSTESTGRRASVDLRPTETHSADSQQPVGDVKAPPKSGSGQGHHRRMSSTSRRSEAFERGTEVIRSRKSGLSKERQKRRQSITELRASMSVAQTSASKLESGERMTGAEKDAAIGTLRVHLKSMAQHLDFVTAQNEAKDERIDELEELVSELTQEYQASEEQREYLEMSEETCQRETEFARIEMEKMHERMVRTIEENENLSVRVMELLEREKEVTMQQLAARSIDEQNLDMQRRLDAYSSRMQDLHLKCKQMTADNWQLELAKIKADEGHEKELQQMADEMKAAADERDRIQSELDSANNDNMELLSLLDEMDEKERQRELEESVRIEQRHIDEENAHLQESEFHKERQRDAVVHKRAPSDARHGGHSVGADQSMDESMGLGMLAPPPTPKLTTTDVEAMVKAALSRQMATLDAAVERIANGSVPVKLDASTEKLPEADSGSEPPSAVSESATVSMVDAIGMQLQAAMAGRLEAWRKETERRDGVLTASVSATRRELKTEAATGKEEADATPQPTAGLSEDATSEEVLVAVNRSVEAGMTSMQSAFAKEMESILRNALGAFQPTAAKPELEASSGKAVDSEALTKAMDEMKGALDGRLTEALERRMRQALTVEESGECIVRKMNIFINEFKQDISATVQGVAELVEECKAPPAPRPPPVAAIREQIMAETMGREIDLMKRIDGLKFEMRSLESAVKDAAHSKMTTVTTLQNELDHLRFDNRVLSAQLRRSEESASALRRDIESRRLKGKAKEFADSLYSTWTSFGSVQSIST